MERRHSDETQTPALLGLPLVTERLAALDRLMAARAATADEVRLAVACLGALEVVVQRRAASTLQRLHSAGVEVASALMQELHASDWRRRWGGAFTLSLIGPVPPAARRVALECLGVDDGDVRWAAAELISASIDEPPVDDLLRYLAEGNVSQRKMAAYCLKSLKCRAPAVEAVLLSALADPEASVRLAGLSALSSLAIDAVATAGRVVELVVDDPDPGVRRSAAWALGQLNTAAPAVVAALHAAAGSADASLRRVAAESLRRLAST